MVFTGYEVIHSIIDSLILISVLSPILYIFILRPMNYYIAELKMANQKITGVNTELENKVIERTKELLQLNMLLKSDYTEALRLSEERYKAVLDSLPLGVAIIDRNMRISSINSALKTWYPSTDFINKPYCFETLKHGNGKGPCEDCPVRKTFDDGKLHELLVKKEDTNLFYRIRTAPIFVDAQVVNVVEIIEDVSEQYNLLVRTKESNDKFTHLFNNVCDIVLVFEINHNKTSKIIEVNEAAIEKLGYSKDELLSMSPTDLVPRDILQMEDFLKIESELRTRKNYSFETTIQTNSGKRIVVEINSTLNPLGSKPVVLCVCRDISERKRFENEILKVNQLLEERILDRTSELTLAIKALEQSENRYRSLIEQSSEGIFIWDLENKQIQEANTQLLKLLDYSREEIIRLKIDDIVSLKEGELNTYIEMLVHGESVYGQRLYKSKSGIFIEVEVNVSPVNYGQSKVCLVSVRDIREKNKTKKALTQSIENLKKTLKETVNALVTVTEKRDPYTAGHQLGVAAIAIAIAKEMRLSEQNIEAIDMAARLHDIGKIYVPSDILNKPGQLTVPEMTIIRSHPEIAYEILSRIPFEVSIAEIVLQHHERFDGSGYPKGLKGNEILLEARILAVADVLEAMSTHRPYRPSLGIEEAVAELIKYQGILYDPAVVQAAISMISLRDTSNLA